MQRNFAVESRDRLEGEKFKDRDDGADSCQLLKLFVDRFAKNSKNKLKFMP
jgi:hypothetical protein